MGCFRCSGCLELFFLQLFLFLEVIEIVLWGEGFLDAVGPLCLPVVVKSTVALLRSNDISIHTIHRYIHVHSLLPRLHCMRIFTPRTGQSRSAYKMHCNAPLLTRVADAGWGRGCTRTSKLYLCTYLYVLYSTHITYHYPEPRRVLA